MSMKKAEDEIKDIDLCIRMEKAFQEKVKGVLGHFRISELTSSSELQPWGRTLVFGTRPLDEYKEKADQLVSQMLNDVQALLVRSLHRQLFVFSRESVELLEKSKRKLLASPEMEVNSIIELHKVNLLEDVQKEIVDLLEMVLARGNWDKDVFRINKR